MSDEVQKIRKRLRELRELHFTGFVNDAQYTESKSVLERKLVDAVMQQAEDAAEAQFAPTMMMDPASLPSAAVALGPRGASPRWWPWLAVAVLVPLMVVAAWWGLAMLISSDAAAENTPRAETVAAPSAATVVDHMPTAAQVTQVTQNAPVSGDSISGTVTLAPAYAQGVGADDTVFVFARAVDGPAMPLAVIRKQVKDLPLHFRLDDSMATWPSASVSAFPRVQVIARISKSGEGQPRKGDLQGQSPPVAVGATELQIEIGTVVE